MVYRVQDTEVSELGKVLRDYRQRNNLSVTELQNFIGFHNTTLFTLETDRGRAVSKVMSDQILNYFNDNESMRSSLIQALKVQNNRVLSTRYII